MKKRFKSKRKNKLPFLKIIGLVLIIYIFFSLTYNLLYNFKLSKLNNEKIIHYIMENNKNNIMKENKLFEKLKSPEFILKYTLNFELKEQPKEVKLTNKEVEKTDEPIVYIYSTHEQESYAFPNKDLYNIIPTVKTAGYILQENLKDLGITSIVEEESVTAILKENGWAYNRSYDASKVLVEKAIQTYPNLQLIIDLHRDSSPLNKTLLEQDNTKYAKVLFVVGKEYDNYESNLNLAKTLNSYITEIIPGISRGISEKSGANVNGIYNQNLSQNSVLIEVGGQYNEIDEVNNTINIIARTILKYLEGEIWRIVKKLGLFFDVAYFYYL